MDMTVHTPSGDELLRHRIDELTVRMRDAEAEVETLKNTAHTELMAVELIKKDIVFIKSGMEEMLVTVRDLSKVPSARWNGLVTAAISSVVAAAAALILG